jgi:hypothetical protein
MLTYFFVGFLKISPYVWPNSGFWCCVFLTLRIILLELYIAHVEQTPIFFQCWVMGSIVFNCKSSLFSCFHSVAHPLFWFLYWHSSFKPECTMEWSRPCPLCWVRSSGPVRAEWDIQHNGPWQGHSKTLRSEVSDSTI